MGMRIAVDGFWADYSWLSYLKRLPINVLKINRSFVKDGCLRKDSQLITSAIISLANELEMEVVTEGVESEEQLRFLDEHDCKYAQGGLYSKPICMGDIEEFMAPC